MYGLVFDGIYQQGNAEGAEPGTMRYRDLNGDGVINDNDRTVIGDSNPKHTGGFNNSFRYKNFNFSFLFQWSYGNDVFNASRLRTNGFQPFMNITIIMKMLGLLQTHQTLLLLLEKYNRCHRHILLKMPLF